LHLLHLQRPGLVANEKSSGRRPVGDNARYFNPLTLLGARIVLQEALDGPGRPGKRIRRRGMKHGDELEVRHIKPKTGHLSKLVRFHAAHPMDLHESTNQVSWKQVPRAGKRQRDVIVAHGEVHLEEACLPKHRPDRALHLNELTILLAAGQPFIAHPARHGKRRCAQNFNTTGRNSRREGCPCHARNFQQGTGLEIGFAKISVNKKTRGLVLGEKHFDPRIEIGHYPADLDWIIALGFGRGEVEQLSRIGDEPQFIGGRGGLLDRFGSFGGAEQSGAEHSRRQRQEQHHRGPDPNRDGGG
jgi:hypothetical protein